MGFLTRLLAGLTAAAALGAGLTGTANAVDVTGATGTTKSVVKLTADDTNNLPDHIVNGSFDYPSVPSWTGLAGSSSNKNNKGKRFATINPGTGKYGSGCAMSTTGRAIPNWNRSSFAWNSTQGDAHYPGMSCEAGNVELNYDSVHHNQFAELTADQQGTAIYQDVKVTPGTMMTWSLKHSSATSAYVDKMQVMIGEPYKETAQEATRIASENGNKVGEKMTTISTPTTSDRADSKKWDTYSGTYLVPDGVTTVRFTFKSVASAEWYSGNDLDDIEFFRSYKLTYDKNSADASGQVPSNQRGKENTTQPAKTKTKTNGKIRLTSDDTSGLPDHLVNGDFSVNYKDQWLTGGWNWTSITPDGKYLNSVRNWNDSATTWKTVNGWDKTKFGWSSTQKDGTDDIQHKAGAVEIQYDDQADNVYAELCAYEAGTAIYQDIKTVPGTLYKVRLKHASLYDGYLDKMQVMIGAPGHEQPVEMTRTGVNGNGDRLNEKSSIIATKVSNTGENNRNHDSQWESYEGTYLIPAGQTVTRFTFRSVGSRNLDHGNLLDDIVFDKAYRLDYDKNSNEAAGSVPSNQRGKENTTQPAKTKTNGTVKTVADENVRYGSLINGDFSYPSFSDIQKNEQENVADLRTFLKSDDGTLWYNMSNTDLSKYGKIGQIPGFDSSRFAWSSTENGSRVELQQDRNTKNTYAEIVAQQDNTSIYQNVSTGNGGVLYKIRLKHASRQSSHADRMQVLVGSDTDHATPVEMTRVISNGHGDKVGGKSTIITTKVSNTDPRDHGNQWETYEGYYQVPEGQKNTVFMFKSLEGFKEYETLSGNNIGNLVDDIEFSRSYKLTYDKNSDYATGSVPSDTTANTVKQAKAKTSGTVKTVADDDSSKSLTVNPGFDVPDYSKLDDGGLHWMYVNPSEGNAWSYYDYINPSAPKHQVSGLSQATFGWQELTGGDHKTTSFELHREKDGNVCADVHGRRTIGQTIDTQAGVAYTVSIRHSGRSKGNAGSVQVLVGPDKDHLQPLEMSRMNVSRTGAKYGDKTGKVGTVITTHSDSVDSTEGDHPAWDHSDDWETYSGTYVATGGKTVFAYRGVDENGDSVSGNDPVADSVIDDLSFKLAYRLSYDKNAADAAGSIPSDEYGKENTVKQAKAKTTGTVRAVADRTASGLTVHDLKKGDIAPAQYGDFKFSTLGNLDANQITDVEGFTVKDNWFPIDNVENPNYVSYLPSRDGATLTLKHVGEWVDSSGVKQWINARLIVNNPDAGCLYYERQTRSVGMGIGKWHASASSRPYLDMSVEFLLDDGTMPQGLRGVTGFTDLDGGTSGYNEGVELVSGFDGAYVRSDAHLTRFGTNGWGGTTDENANASDSHGMKHYLGATFTGSSIRVRYSVTAGQLRGSLFQPVDSTIAYRLTYDKNAQDAAGQVPSDTTANTVKQAKAKATGTVRTVADRTASGLTVHDLETDDVPGDYRQFVLNTTDTRLSQVEFEDGAWYRSTDSSSQGMWPLKAGASLTIPSVGDWTDPSGRTHQISMTMRLKDWNGGSVSELYRFDGHGNIVGDGRFWINTAYGSGYSSLPAKVKAAMGKVDTSKRVGCSWTVEFTYADTGEKVPDTFKGVTGFNDLDGWDAQSGLKFEGVQLLSGFDGAYKRSDAELGTYGTNGFAGIGHDAGDEAHLNAPQQSRHRLAATWTGSTFTFSYDLSNPAGRTDGSRMTFGAPVTRTAVLTYDKNAADAAGSVPSNTTPGTTRTASSKTDGKVSDLVQRTTTHEDGSVTVRTVDQSTDVVSGCQVYYPAGQRITLATVADDDDCWDSSMLSRPGHTQLGWNQDRNATQAQAQVTMVEGGMTVYAVWVGNPVLTYDTNKPSTWGGQMPSTPASVSVLYNTAAADKSGWAAGDTSKIRGYKFLGWYTGPQDNAGLYDWATPLTGNVTVYAHWQRLQANVVYDKNASDAKGSHANTTGWQYSDVTVPSDTSKSFTREGYYFKYWNTQKDGKGTTYKDGGQVPLQDKDVTLYAIWLPYHENFVETGGVSLPVLIVGGVVLLAAGVASTIVLTRRMRGEQ